MTGTDVSRIGRGYILASVFAAVVLGGGVFVLVGAEYALGGAVGFGVALLDFFTLLNISGFVLTTSRRTKRRVSVVAGFLAAKTIAVPIAAFVSVGVARVSVVGFGMGLSAGAAFAAIYYTAALISRSEYSLRLWKS